MVALLEWVSGWALLLTTVAGALCLLACGLIVWRRGRAGWREAARSTALDVAPLAALTPILALALAPSGERGEASLNVVPFRDLVTAAFQGGRLVPAIVDVLANVAVFVPIGATLGLRFPLAGGIHVALACAGVSVGIELGQLFLAPGRATDVTDVISNVAGALGGYVLVRLSRPARAAG